MTRRLFCGIQPETLAPLYAIIDDEDWEAAAKYCWSILWRDGRIIRVKRGDRKTGKYESCALHHFVLGATPKNGYITDHIDGNPLNNVKSNLREVTYRTNARNNPRYKRGVQRTKYAWEARMSFRVEEHAKEAYKLMEEYRLTLPGEE